MGDEADHVLPQVAEQLLGPVQDLDQGVRRAVVEVDRHLELVEHDLLARPDLVAQPGDRALQCLYG